jgi:hypothetical protein
MLFIDYLVLSNVDSAEVAGFQGCRKFRNLHNRRECTPHRFQRRTFFLSATTEKGSKLTTHEIEVGGVTARTCAEALAEDEPPSIGLLWDQVWPYAETMTH